MNLKSSSFLLVLGALLISRLASNWASSAIAFSKADRSAPLPTIHAQRAFPSGIPVRGCTDKPNPNPPQPNIETRFEPGSPALEHFRLPPTPTEPLPVAGVSPKVIDSVRHHWPEEHVALAHPTNFGERYLHDLKGRSTHHEPIIVLHETVSSGESTIRFFQTPHPKDEDQASYHALIRLNGSIYYFVPPDKRAFGAGQSVFVNPKTGRTESVQTNPSLLPSVNNFAYHISLETPPEGRIGGAHPGYTSLQYLSLAWLVAKTGVPEHRITTHQAVDRSGSRNDPRQFNHARFQTLLSVYPKTNEIKIGCP